MRVIPESFTVHSRLLNCTFKPEDNFLNVFVTQKNKQINKQNLLGHAASQKDPFFHLEIIFLFIHFSNAIELPESRQHNLHEQGRKEHSMHN